MLSGTDSWRMSEPGFQHLAEVGVIKTRSDGTVQAGTPKEERTSSTICELVLCSCPSPSVFVFIFFLSGMETGTFICPINSSRLPPYHQPLSDYMAPLSLHYTKH